MAIIMGALQLHPPLPLFNHNTTKSYKLSSKLSMSRGFHKLNASQTNSTSATTDDLEEEPPSFDFAFVSPKLLPDGSPDVHIRSAVGGQKLRDIMLDGNIDLYGPYDKPLSNCAGGGTCGTCMVEVVEGKELLSSRTNKEKELLKRKPKTWRLACQTVVGKPDSRGEIIIQQLPEWKAHEWE